MGDIEIIAKIKKKLYEKKELQNTYNSQRKTLSNKISNIANEVSMLNTELLVILIDIFCSRLSFNKVVWKISAIKHTWGIECEMNPVNRCKGSYPSQSELEDDIESLKKELLEPNGIAGSVSLSSNVELTSGMFWHFFNFYNDYTDDEGKVSKSSHLFMIDFIKEHKIKVTMDNETPEEVFSAVKKLDTYIEWEKIK